MKEEGIRLMPSRHRERSFLLNNIAVVLQTRFERTKALVDLNRAIDLLQDGMRSSSMNPWRSMLLSNLGNIYQWRYLKTRDAADLKKAINRGGKAIALLGLDRRHYTSLFNNLSISLKYKYL
jgi:Tetratricopeptide repeat